MPSHPPLKHLSTAGGIYFQLMSIVFIFSYIILKTPGAILSEIVKILKYWKKNYKKLYFKGTVSLILRDIQCKNDIATFTTVPLTSSSNI